MFNHFSFSLLLLTGCYTACIAAEPDTHSLLARGEHRIEVQRFGRKDPALSIDIMQSNFYNEHHEDYVIRLEDLNNTINREIQEEVDRQYNEWFEAEFNRRLEDYHDTYHSEVPYDDTQETPSEGNDASYDESY